MPHTPIVNFDSGQIPDTNDPANFHTSATSTFDHLAEEVIPKFNTNLAWVETALAGSETVVDAVAALQTNTPNADNLTSGTLDHQRLPWLTGSVAFFAMDTAPTGYIKANGATISTTTYANLFAAIGHTFGGSGSAFKVPDLRGEFLRGWSDGRSVDSGRGFGSFQGDLFKSHTHIISHSSLSGVSAGGNIAGGSPVNSATSPTAASGGSETRPRNVALLACIKY